MSPVRRGVCVCLCVCATESACMYVCVHKLSPDKCPQSGRAGDIIYIYIYIYIYINYPLIHVPGAAAPSSHVVEVAIGRGAVNKELYHPRSVGQEHLYVVCR